MAHGRWRVVVAVLAAPALTLAIVASVVPGPATAAGPDLRLRPNDGPAGSTTRARGRDFTAHATGALIWGADGMELGRFEADDQGDFAVDVAVPAVPAGTYTVIARAGAEEASDTFEVTSAESDAVSPTPAAATGTVTGGASPAAGPPGDACTSGFARRVEVGTAAELTVALAGAQPGDLIWVADGVYPGTFVAASSGTAEARIALCGSRNAVIDGGDVGNGYALHLTGDYWTVSGIAIANTLKGVMLDDADFTMLEGLAVHEIGHEAVHFRTHSSDNVIRDCDIFDTGRKKAKFGEGVYIGSAVSNWGTYSDGKEDRSDRNQVLRNRIWNTTAENIDVKEGTAGGLIEGNVLDGAGLTGADSWRDLKGNGYVVRGNTGTNSPTDGFQTHVINDLPWGRDNLFDGNTAEVNGDGFGFYIHDPEESHNTVRCTNRVTGAAKGFANVACT